MRARYAAFAYGLAGFLIETTHPEGAAYEADHRTWHASILEFSGATAFAGLEILGAEAEGDEGWVTFRAALQQGTRDVSFTERSRFLREDGRWRYHSGVIS